VRGGGIFEGGARGAGQGAALGDGRRGEKGFISIWAGFFFLVRGPGGKKNPKPALGFVVGGRPLPRKELVNPKTGGGVTQNKKKGSWGRGDLFFAGFFALLEKKKKAAFAACL